MKIFTQKIEALSLITAAGCNLECKYCFANHSRTNNKEYAVQMQKECKDALDDGTFLNNILKTLEISEQDKNDIKRIEL